MAASAKRLETNTYIDEFLDEEAENMVDEAIHEASQNLGETGEDLERAGLDLALENMEKMPPESLIASV